MLKPQKKKITKKELKEDKFVETALKAKTYLEENQKQVTIIVVAILVAVVLVMLYRNYHHNKIVKANALLGMAQVEYQNMHYNKARQFLNRLFEEYDGTDAAIQGYFILANLNFQQEKYKEAELAYKRFIEEYDGSKILLASGYAGYAACLEHRGAHEEAAQYYLKAQKIAPEFTEAANYLYLAGKNFAKAGKLEQARQAFERIVEKYPESKRLNDAKAQLILLAHK